MKGMPAGKAGRGIEASLTAYVRGALGFFCSVPSLLGGIDLLLLLFKMVPCGKVFCLMFSVGLVLMGMRREGLGLESNCTTPACPRDIANSRAVFPWRSGISGFESFRSNSNFTIPS